MASFGSQLHAWAKKTGEKLEDVDVAFKLQLFERVVAKTRVADPASWAKPDPSYLGGQMRGNWQVTTGTPASKFLEGVKNTGESLPASEAAGIRPFSLTYLTNNTPYVLVYEEKDAMVGKSIADARRMLRKTVAEVKQR